MNAIDQLQAMALKVNSPELEAILAAYGPERYADAQFVNLVRQAMLDLHQQMEEFVGAGDATATKKGVMKLAGDFDPLSSADIPRILLANMLRAGIAKLYDSIGTNEDGSMSQKAASLAFAKTVYADEAGTDLVENTAGQTVMKVFHIPAARLSNGVYWFGMYFSKTFTAAGQTGHACEFNAYLSESPSSFTTAIAKMNALTGTGWQPVERKLSIYTKNGASKLVVGNQANTVSTDTAAAYAVQEYPINLNVDHYIHIVAIPGTTAVKFKMTSSHLIKF